MLGCAAFFLQLTFLRHDGEVKGIYWHLLDPVGYRDALTILSAGVALVADRLRRVRCDVRPAQHLVPLLAPPHVRQSDSFPPLPPVIGVVTCCFASFAEHTQLSDTF